MDSQKMQNRIGKYQVVGLLSYGSTSHVFKIKEIQDPNPLLSSSTLNQTNSELVVINMNQGMNRNMNEDQKMSEGTKVLARESQKEWILKLYNMELIKENQFLQTAKYDVFVQMLLLTYLNHPGIVKAKQMLLEYSGTINPTDSSQITRKLVRAGIVMEICQKGSFNSLINYIDRTKNLKENNVNIMKFYLSQVANTLMYLNQECKILHRDLKAQNIMINKQLDIKVIDYGVSKINLSFLQKIFSHPQKKLIFQLFGFQPDIAVKDLYAKIRNHERKRKNLIGSKHYISPELVQKQRSDMEMIDEAYEKTDIWSFGVFMYRIFHDKYPFEGRNLRQILYYIMHQDTEAQINQQLPDEVRQVIQKCLQKDYGQRASWKQLMKMRYFAQMPVGEVFNSVSPICELIMQNKQEKQKILLNTDRVYFDDRLVLKYENEGNKKRRVMLIKQKEVSDAKILVLKQKQSISMQISLSNLNGLKIQRQQNHVKIHYQDKHIKECLHICSEFSKEMVDKFIECIFEAFEPRQVSENKETKQQTKQISTGEIDCEVD